MKRASKFIAAALVALLLVPMATTGAYADNRSDQSSQSDEDDDKRKRDKPKFQTKFFSE
jgi:hypothetical protein